MLFSQAEKLAVLFRLPAHLLNRFHFILDEFACQTLVDTLVEQYLHSASASTRPFAVSNKATTCSCVTVGNPARKSSIVSPASRYSKSVCTGTRVPVKTGVPPMISREVVIKVLLMRDRLSAKTVAGKRVSRQILRFP